MRIAGCEGPLPLDRVVGDFDIHRTIWIRDNVIHELGAALPYQEDYRNQMRLVQGVWNKRKGGEDIPHRWDFCHTRLQLQQ